MRISELYTTRHPVVSIEFFPPLPSRKPEFIETAIQLAGEKPDFFSVTCPIRPERRPSTIETVRALMSEVGLPVMAHVVCANDHRDNVHDFLEQVRDAAVENVLLLRGDPLPEKERIVDRQHWFEYSSDLIEHARSHFAFCIAAAAHPEIHPEAANFDENMAAIRLKAEKGCDFFVTQFFFDNRDYFRLVDGARERGIDAPIVPGIMPVVNLERIRNMCQMNGSTIPRDFLERLERAGSNERDVVEIGLQYALEQCRELLSRGAPGVHLYSLNRADPARRLLRALRSEFG